MYVFFSTVPCHFFITTILFVVYVFIGTQVVGSMCNTLCMCSKYFQISMGLHRNIGRRIYVLILFQCAVNIFKGTWGIFASDLLTRFITYAYHSLYCLTEMQVQVILTKKQSMTALLIHVALKTRTNAQEDEQHLNTQLYIRFFASFCCEACYLVV